MVPQVINMVDVVIRSVRVFKIQKNGDLRDKFDVEVCLLCEYDPQGFVLKIFSGNFQLLFKQKKEAEKRK